MATVQPEPDDLEKEYRQQKNRPAKKQEEESSGALDAVETVVDVADTVISSAGCLWLMIKIPFRILGAIWGIFSD